MTDREPRPDAPAHHEQFALLDVATEEKIEQVHGLVGSFAEKYELPARLAEVLRPETALHFRVGLPGADRSFVKSYIDNVQLALTLFDEDFEKVKHGNFEPINSEADDGGGRLRRNVIIPSAYASQTFNWQQTLLASREVPLYQSALLCPMIESMRVSHFHIYGCDPKTDTALRFSGEDFELLTGKPGAGEVQESVVAQRLRELGLVNETKAKLDTKWELFNAVLQVELMRLITHDFVDFGRISSHSRGRPASQYEVLASALGALLHFDDLESKVRFLRGLPEAFYTLPQRATNESQATHGLLLVERTEHLVRGLEDQFTAMNLVFEEQDFPVPETLTTVMPEAFLKERTRRTREKKIKRQEQRKQVEIRGRREQLVLLHASLLQRVEVANKQWHLSSKARKSQGLAEVNKSLLQGFETASGERIEIDIPADEVSTITGILAKLQRMTESTNEAASAAELQAALVFHDALARQRDEVFSEARAIDVANLEYPKLIKLNEQIARLQHQWPKFEKLMQEKWPTNGRQLAQRIKALLDGIDKQGDKEEGR